MEGTTFGDMPAVVDEVEKDVIFALLVLFGVDGLFPPVDDHVPLEDGRVLVTRGDPHSEVRADLDTLSCVDLPATSTGVLLSLAAITCSNVFYTYVSNITNEVRMM